jgi:phage baseplate assembly protein W
MRDPVKNFLGSGWKFPPRLDSRGRIELVEQDRDVEEAIRIILMTRKGERPMRPEFGSELHTLVFAPNDASTGGLARRYVMEALAMWEPRIVVTTVNARPDPRYPNRLLVDIDYRHIFTNSDRNLVFPFYVIPGED